MSADDLAGRVALVTGSSAGIGKQIAEALARRGAAVVAHGVDARQNAEVHETWQGFGWRTMRSDADLADPEGPATLFSDVATQLGPPDILVLNASIEIPESLQSLTAHAMNAQVVLNLTANCQLLQASVPPMRDRAWGRIIAIGSVQEERPNARHLFYAGTKSALTSIILNLARNERAPGVTFNVVRPGAILTDRNRLTLSDPAFARTVLDRIPLGRLGEPGDCTGVVSLLCSAAGEYINGAVVAVDGGMRL
jgi:NAD(P)-dependent dehydrogenase (short-subunit alcohol dehydrogenase family)